MTMSVRRLIPLAVRLNAALMDAARLQVASNVTEQRVERPLDSVFHRLSERKCATRTVMAQQRGFTDKETSRLHKLNT